ncbi:superoxide dismutase [Aliivibrio finisterrensis]|uniref:Superoxide dismutase [Cu-Zn] n=1 Tax=Aliivibrio finisterrensis TaxID=511998 RepID=A0A4Q5KNX8_9GAMM|nr:MULTISPECIES: superoxide dismutase family protein [Aliivibrio]MDD9174046.1 superoxide dismutase family protein [Aliivibrio sp. S3TY1]MDD9191123.1 superoxide dismutase family protein [Aliivibrio sp. S2TY2]RYU48171.1 superoxide dismutase [Aliivibrio finisterrensis]
MFNKLLLTTLLAVSSGANSADLSIEMKDLESGNTVGYISAVQNDYGVVFTPSLLGLPQGLHGFHIHENASCDTLTKGDKTILGGAAGGHYDPMKTEKHGFPWSNDNHLGDLPPIYVDMNGKAQQPVLSPRITLANLSGRSVMIHAGGDNHSDHPHILGGGGARLVCGVIK